MNDTQTGKCMAPGKAARLGGAILALGAPLGLVAAVMLSIDGGGMSSIPIQVLFFAWFAYGMGMVAFGKYPQRFGWHFLNS